jgi:hypothetical protein
MFGALWRAAVFAAALVAPTAAAGQVGGYGSITVTVTGAEDGNLFSEPENPQSDLVARMGSTFEAGYISEPFKLVMQYAFEAERYREHPELDKDLARQDAALQLRRMVTRRLVLDLRSRFLETRSPRELNLESGITMGLLQARRFVGRPSMTYELSTKTRLGLGYEFRRDTLAGGITTDVQQAQIGLTRQTGRRSSVRLEYRARRFEFGDAALQDAHVALLGWQRDISRRAGLEVMAGPRYSARAIQPEISANLYVRFRESELYASYSRTQSTSIGHSGTFENQYTSVGATYQPTRRVSVTVEPHFSTTKSTSVYGLNVAATLRPVRHFSVITSAEMGVQEGTLQGGSQRFPYRAISVKLATMLAGPRRDDAPREF